MKQYLMLAVLGLHPLTGNALCAFDYETCRQQERTIDALRQQEQADDAKREAEWQRSRPVQVIEPGGVRTYYPSSDGSSWITHDPKPGSR